MIGGKGRSRNAFDGLLSTRQHPIGFVENDDLLGAVGQPLDHSSVGSMAKADVFDHRLLK